MWLSVTLQILAALAIFVFSQWFSKFVLEPIHKQRVTIGRVAFALTFYANVYFVKEFFTEMSTERQENEVKRIEEAREAIRRLAGELEQSLWEVPFYWMASKLHLVRSKEKILTASAGLVGWSNELYRKEGLDEKRRKAIVESLGIDKRIY